MQTPEFGKNERRDEEILKDISSKPMELKGGEDSVEKVEYIHEEVGRELLSLFTVTKMSPSERALMACRLKGMHIEDALMFCQRYGFLLGVRIDKAIEIENEMKLRMMTTLYKMSSAELIEKAKTDNLIKTLVADHNVNMPPTKEGQEDAQN